MTTLAAIAAVVFWLATGTAVGCVALLVFKPRNDPLSNQADRLGAVGAGDVPIHNGGNGAC